MQQRAISRLVILLFTAVAFCGGSLPCASAQQYPSRVVKFLVPQAPGGATDVFARKLGQMLSEKWGKPVIVENKSGAAGVIGTDFVAKAAPDGYILLVTYAGSQAINPSLYHNLPFELGQGLSDGRYHRQDAVFLDSQSDAAGEELARICCARA